MLTQYKVFYGLLFLLATTLITACSDKSLETTTARESTTSNEQSKVTPSIQLNIYKSPSCGCCGKWVEHMTNNGFSANIHHPDNLTSIKREKGIGTQYQSCHTAVSKDGYVFEGHIPAKYIQQFLKEKPDNVIGLAVPAMPLGSPGMEVDDKFTPYQVLLLKKDGSSEIYANITTPGEQYQ
jgi:hypothetical protein|tara:strand:+ start:1562 stop:2104 length:543 start_codon:yes stop_codon:yes gene_type:complete